ncbi:MAG: polyketide synthase, partial [Proteobacteria bacterium]|nr:polyketide synthase [Pseudomonadota bacterium]
MRLSTVKQALFALQQLRARSREPIAIVGLACRLPGKANDVESLWQLLAKGVDAISEVPPDRWDLNELYDPAVKPGKVITRHGGFLDDISSFDAHFFGISPREALAMDPQQRLLLEVTWEALENAAIPPDSLKATDTGVYAATGMPDYARRHFWSSDSRLIDAYSGTGTFSSVAAGRISYVLGLNGPAMVIDTACSSSLVAAHLACNALRRRECPLALVGAANLLVSPEPTIFYSQMKTMALDGRCKTFDDRADGYVRGEGCGVLVLKRLSDAEAAGDRIHALIVGSAVNQDGRSNGLTSPNGLAQQAVIRQALQNADREATEVGYVEAHGTGTPLGDPIEVEALKAVYGNNASTALGSIKTNVGHLEPAAGIAGLLKVILMLQRGEIPPHLHLQELNRRISLAGTGISIPTTLTPRPDLA